jgi:myo-inositol-1(or 4)-monophosphatase
MPYPSKKIRQTLLQALREAGKIVKHSLRHPQIVAKKAEISIVTETDTAAEKKIVGIIRRTFPDHSILTEESPPSGRSSSRWIIDPLDGTTNFAHTYPVACVSIAFEANGILEAGGVFDPFRNELFYAEQGKGATCNGRPIRVSRTEKLIDALIATGFPYDQKDRADLYLSVFKPFLIATQGLRRPGAAALDLCHVACGRFDGYWEYKLQPWDKAAGILMVREAGGTVTNFAGGPLTLEDTQNVISNGVLHDAMLEILKPFREIQ